MMTAASHLYQTDPADQRAVSDYAIALTRAAAVLPDNQGAEQLSLLRESQKLLQEVARINPQNTMNQWDMAHGYNLLGDALMKSGDREGALHAWRDGLKLAESLLSAGVTSPVPTLVSLCQKLGVEAARDGDRDRALARARRAFEVSDEAGLRAKGRPVSVQKFLTPQGRAAMGLVYSQLNHSREDARMAVLWLQKSLAAWSEVKDDPAFTPLHQRQMQQVEAALAKLK